MKRVLGILSLILSITILAACGGTDSISIALEATEDIPEKFAEQIERFTEETGIEVEIQTYAGSDNYERALLGQIAGQQAPDVFFLDGGNQLREYAEEGALLAIDDLVTMDLDNFEASILAAFYHEDSLYGIPKDYNTSVLFYHEDLVEGDIPTTIDAFEAAVMASTTDDVYGFGMDPKLNYYLPFIQTMGADILNSDGTINETELDSDEHAAALEMLRNFYINDYATSPFLSGAGWDGELFANRDIAMLYGGSWITGVIGDDEEVTGIAPLPTANGDASMLFVAGWAISSQSDNPEAAMELIEFITSDEELVQGHIDGLIGLPPTISGMDALINEMPDDPYLPVYTEVVQNGYAFGSIPPRFLDNYNEAIENMIYDNVSVTDTIAAIKDYE